MNKNLTIAAVVLGIGSVFLAAMYWMTPANALPHFMPGYDPAMTKVHVKHGIAALLLGLGFFAYAWFKSGPKSTDEK